MQEQNISQEIQKPKNALSINLEKDEIKEIEIKISKTHPCSIKRPPPLRRLTPSPSTY